VVFITGGGTGIGRAVSTLLAERGARRASILHSGEHCK
jgi:NAD(P)-dependent dehydrogenase (short-subunit alcohol dehydrogenase family)